MERSSVSSQYESEDSEEYSCNDPDVFSESEKLDADKVNIELFKHKTINDKEAESYIKNEVDAFCRIGIAPSVAKVLLYFNRWNTEAIKQKYLEDPLGLLAEYNIIPPSSSSSPRSDSPGVMKTLQSIQRHGFGNYNFSIDTAKGGRCEVCFSDANSSDSESLSMKGLSCGHRYCTDCWDSYFKVQIGEHSSIDIKCISLKCSILALEDFVLPNLKCSSDKEQYQKFLFDKFIECHPYIRFCLGIDCPMFILALEEPKARCVTCDHCDSKFCFACNEDYHAPTTCAVLRQWFKHCQDDSNTMHYMRANTKPCPNCDVAIEKNEGCNHMTCRMCKHEFCWLCLIEWKQHANSYYSCNVYGDDSKVDVDESVLYSQTYLKRYLFFYERWENHEHSLRLEKERRARIQAHINEKVMKSEGTWIDWQYLLSAADTLRNCRYTLKYTYPHAYFVNTLPRKELFVYLQALLESEVEDLSWKIEHAEITDRADLTNKMNVCEKHRITLLQEFLTD